MSATQYFVTTNRYIKQGRTAAPYAMTATAPAIAEALASMQAASWVDSPWSIRGSYPDHTGKATVESDLWDAYAVCTDIDAITGAQNARLGCVAYRVALPAAAYASGAKIVSVGISVAGDPYLVNGARVAVKLSSTATPSADWATIIAGDAHAAGVSARTTAVVNGLTRWYPVTSAQTITLNGVIGIQALQYVYIYLSLEDYPSCSRMPWVEGGAALGPVISLTYDNAVSGFSAGDSLGGRIEPADVVLLPVGPKCGYFGYCAEIAFTQPTDFSSSYVGQANACINRFWKDNTKLTDLATYITMPSGVSAGLFMAQSGTGHVYTISGHVIGGVMPLVAGIPARMPIKRIVLPAPPSYTDIQMQVSAYWVDGIPAVADEATIPNTDPLFWRGETATPTIAGLPGLLLGTVRLLSRPTTTWSIPTTWPGFSVRKYGYIYLIFMPLDATIADTNFHGIGSLAHSGVTPYPLVSLPWIPASISLSSSAS
jgi:hypothetical protein